MKVELIYDSDCPNVPRVRGRLVKALKQAKAPIVWTQWERSDEQAPSYVPQYASPTILIDGVDIGGEASELDGQGGCRLYKRPDGSFDGIPPFEAIVDALKRAAGYPNPAVNSRASVFASIGTVIIAGLPVGTCPACLPAYAGILSSLGLGFAFDSVWSLAVLGVLLTICLGTLAWRANQRNGYKPLLYGLVASILVMLGKANVDADPILYLGSGLLLVACIWNVWPRKKPLQKRTCCQ